MSRIRRLSQVISEEGRRALAAKQAARIRDAAFGIVDQANLNTSPARKVTKKAAFTVVLRSLQSTRDLPFSLREHMALKELSQYITLAQSDKSHSLTLSNTDLLPVAHPRSTRNHSMTASALAESRARWVANDPRVVDGYAKTIIASALTAEQDSVEHVYYCSILSNLPQGVVPADIILAAGNPFSGGNSSAERSLRARLQRRDREGKFAFMGGGLSALVRRSNGKVFNLVGRPIIDGPNGDDIQMQLPDGRIVNIPASKGMFVKAIINPTPDGFSKAPAKTATTDNIINEEDLVYVDAPEGWEVRPNGLIVSKDGEWLVQKVKDKNGNEQYQVDRVDPKSGRGLMVPQMKSDWEDVLDGIADYKENDGKKAVLPSKTEQYGGGVDTLNPDGSFKNPVQLPNKNTDKPKKFDFEYPAGAIKMKIDESYDPEGRIDEESPDFTDDPAELAQIFDARDLIQALEQGVLPEEEGDNAVGYGVLRFNGGDEYVPVQAIYNALDEAGEDAPLELARIYDKGLGGSDNEDALNDNRKGVAQLDQAKPDVAESFERTTKQSVDEAPAAEEPKFDEAEMDLVPLPPVLEGLSDAEMNEFMESKDHTPYLPENESIEMPEGYNSLSPEPFQSWREVTADTPDAVLPEGFSDNPVFLAQSIEKEKLEAELRRSIEPDSATPGYANISLQDEDGEEFIANVPGEAVRDALQLLGVDTNEIIKSIADEGFAGQKDEEPVAELPEEPGIPTAQDEKLRKMQQDVADYYAKQEARNREQYPEVYKRKEQLQKNAEDRVDEQGRAIPEGWGISMKETGWGVFPSPDRFSNVYGLNNFEASVNPDGSIKVKDRNNVIEDKSYENWDELQKEMQNLNAEYRDAARKKVADIAKGYGYSDEQIAAFDSMSQQELADFFANPENQTEAHNRALDDLNTSWAVDLPSPAQRKRWASIAADEKILAQAGDAPSPENVVETPTVEDPDKNIDDEALLDRRLAGESLDSVAKDLGISREEVRRREMDALRNRREANPESPEASERKPGTATQEEDVKNILSDLDAHMDESGTSEGAAMAISQVQDKVKAGQKALADGDIETALSYFRDAYDDLENGYTDEGSFESSKASAEAMQKLEDLIISFEGAEPVPAKTLESLKRSKELSDGEKEVLDNNAWVQENAGSLQPIEAKDVQVGDFIWNAFHGRYEKVLSNKYAGVMNRMHMRVFNVKNGQEEDRYFEMDSPLRNVRRPGIEDQAEPIPSAKAQPRGGKRNVIKRKPVSERIVAKEGRRMGGNFDKEGFYKDKNGVALVPGDVVMHKDPDKAGKWKRGVVKLRIGAQVEEGKKAGAVGRKGVAYLDYLIVQWEGEEDEYAIKQGGRQVKAKNLVKHEGNIDGMVMPEFRGGNVVPNTPEKPVADSPAQKKLIDTPEIKPAAPVAPAMPKPMYKAEVEDQKGNKFTISVIKIDGMYEAAVFTEDNKLNAIIAKNTSFADVQEVIGRFIGDVADSNDGENVLRLYGDLPSPAEQLAFTGETVEVPELPAVKSLDLKEAKARAKTLAANIQDKDIPGPDAAKQFSENEKLRMKSHIMSYLAPSGVDRRQNGRFNDELVYAHRYAMMLGWFDEAREIAALQKRVDKLPLRPMDDEFNANAKAMEELHPIVAGMELELAGQLDYDGRRNVNALMEAINKVIINPDPYNPNFRNGILRGRTAIDDIVKQLESNQGNNAKSQELANRMKELKQYFDNFGELPKLPPRKIEDADKQMQHLAEIAREFEGLSIQDLRNGQGDWKFEKTLTAGINKVYLLRNALTGERIVVKFDNDYDKKIDGQFAGNGIKAEEIVAGLYKELGFAQPAFVAVNPDNTDPSIGGVGIMEYAGDGFFGLADIKVHNNARVRKLDDVAEEHREELLNFLVGNAIIGNTDRHGGNFMWGVDPATGKARLIPIDNGLALFNANMGEPARHLDNPLYHDPNLVVIGRYGNFNQVGPIAKRWIQEIGEDNARNQIVEFAERMRERAKAMKFVDPRANAYIEARADYILSDPQKFLDTVLRYW